MLVLELSTGIDIFLAGRSTLISSVWVHETRQNLLAMTKTAFVLVGYYIPAPVLSWAFVDVRDG